MFNQAVCNKIVIGFWMLLPWTERLQKTKRCTDWVSNNGSAVAPTSAVSWSEMSSSIETSVPKSKKS